MGGITVYNGFDNSMTVEALSQNEVYSICVIEANGPFGYEEYFIDPSAQNPIKVITSTDRHYALNFDGTDDFVEAVDVDIPPTDWTIEAWVRFEGSNANYYGIMDFFNDSPYFGLGLGKLEVFNIVTAPDDFPVGVWTHVAASYSDSKDSLNLFINGENVAGVTHTTNFTGSQLGIGGDVGGPSEIWHGAIDEVRVWDVQRTKSEIANSLDTELTGTEPNLIAYFAFNEGPGNSSTFDGVVRS